MSRLTITYSDLYTKVSEFLGMGSSPTGTNLTKVKDIVARGYRQFLYPIDKKTGELHVWSFVKQLYTVATKPGIWKYPLPDNFSEFIDEPHFDDDSGYHEVTRIAPEQILEKRAISVSSGFPLYCAVAPFTFDGQIGTFYELWIDPKPDTVYPLKFFYRIDPLKPSNDGDFLVGGIKAVEAQIETCLAIAEKQEDEEVTTHSRESLRLIQDLIRADVVDETGILGNLHHPRPPLFRWYSALPDDAGDAVYVGD